MACTACRSACLEKSDVKSLAEKCSREPRSLLHFSGSHLIPGLLFSLLVAACQAAPGPPSALPPPAISIQKPIAIEVITPTSLPAVEPLPTGAAVDGMARAAIAPESVEPPATLWIPDRIVVPAIELDAPVVAVAYKDAEYGGKTYREWLSPKYFAAGWHQTSAPLAAPGNTVLNGHHNIYGEVFGRLADLEQGDRILMYSGEQAFAYVIALKLILLEQDQPIEVRAANARWIDRSQDERLTLVSCWPHYNNSHRIIIVATPVSLRENGVHD